MSINQPIAPEIFRQQLLNLVDTINYNPELHSPLKKLMNLFADHYKLLDEQKWDNYELKERYEWFIAKNGLIDKYVKYMDEHEDLYLNGEPEEEE